MGHINNHVNVYNTCLRILRKKGYKLRVEGELDKEEIIIPESLTWYAEKGDYSSVAANPLELLGLAGIHEYKGFDSNESYWWSVKGENIYQELIDDTFPDDD